MLTLFFIFILILILFYGKVILRFIRKKKLQYFFNPKDLKHDIEAFHKRKTVLYFYCEKLISKYYSKLTIFNKDYNLYQDAIIKIEVNKLELMDSVFTENIILQSPQGDAIDFIINISYNMDNYYQLILDKMTNPLSLEIVFYSKQNQFPKLINANQLILKDYGNNTIHNLKRYNLINVSKKQFFSIYNKFSSNKLNEKNKKLLYDKNSLFINFINKNGLKYEGRIFEQKKDSDDGEFTNEEVELLSQINLLINIYIKKIHLKKYLIPSMHKQYKKMVNNKDNLVRSINKKICETCFFNKYFCKQIKDEMLNLIEASIFLSYIELKGDKGITTFFHYLENKKRIIDTDYEFNNFEKLMISINLKDLTINYRHFNFVRLYNLPFKSPFVESEKIFLDIIQELKENSALYFFYLQINSLSGLDYDSLNTWYKIKYIPLIRIKAHLLYSRHLFCFTYNNSKNIAAFVNPQTLIVNFNTDEDVGYKYNKNLEFEIDVNNTVKLLFCKLHESVHSKFNCGMKNHSSPRYLLNSDLKKLDACYDIIKEYKNGCKLKDSEKKGEDIGEEGYACDMFLYDTIIKTDLLLSSFNDLKQFKNVNLYIGDNFKDLNELILNVINQNGTNTIKKKKKRINKIKKMNTKKYKNQLINNDEELKRTPIYFFNNYPLDSRY